MTSPFLRSYDDIFLRILTDYTNLDSSPDVSQGSTTYINGAVQSSALWTLYRYMDYIQRQNFITTADSASLDKYGTIHNVPRTTDETDATYLERLLTHIQQPPSGGNSNDFKTWALDSTNSYYTVGDVTYYNKYVKVVSQSDGHGTVGVYTIPNDETIVNDGGTTYEEDLRQATQDYIESVMPMGSGAVVVHVTDPAIQSVTVNVSPATGDTLDTVEIKDEIQNMMRAKGPGEPLYESDITYVCRNFGAAVATVTTPSNWPVGVADGYYLRDNVITVNEV